MSKPFPVLIEPDGTRLGSFVHIAEELGVSTNRVHGWASRRSASGFPEPVRRGVLSGREVDLYDIDECRVWHLYYVPVKGRPVAGGPAEISRALGVSVKQVCKWIERRAANGCPEPGPDGTHSVDAWKTWHAQYSPQRNQHSRRRAA